MVLNRFYVPSLIDLKRENIEYIQLAAAVRELLACERVPRNTVYMCCGSKDGRLLDTEKVAMRLP